MRIESNRKKTKRWWNCKKKILKTILNKINNNQIIRTKFDTWQKLKEDKIKKNNFIN